MMLDVQSRLASPNRYQVVLGLSLLYVRGFLQRYLGKVITVDMPLVKQKSMAARC
jgi:hypothetical protein